MIGPKALCPCGSNKKYKTCCRTKGIRFAINKEGKLVRKIRVSEAEIVAATDHRDSLMKEAGPDAPVSNDIIASALQQAGADQAAIYAYKKTGLVVTSKNQEHMSAEELQKWDEAIEEFRNGPVELATVTPATESHECSNHECPDC